MDDRSNNKHDETFVQEIIRVVRAQAILHHVPTDELDDCVLDFLPGEVSRQGGDDLVSLDDEALGKAAETWCRRWAYCSRTRRHRETQLYGPDGCAESGPAGRLASHERGPEELVQAADLSDRLLAPLSQLTAGQRRLFVRYYLDQAGLADLAEETGRSSHAIRQAIYAIRKRVKRIIECAGMDEGEIHECLSLLDRLRIRQ